MNQDKAWDILIDNYMYWFGGYAMPTCTICGAIATKKVEVALFTSVEEEWRCDTHNPQRKKEENKSEDLSEKYNPSNGYII